MQGLLVQFFQSVLEMPFKFAEIALSDPISALLILFGAALVGAASLVFGYLTLGAVASVFTSGGGARSPPPEAR